MTIRKTISRFAIVSMVCAGATCAHGDTGKKYYFPTVPYSCHPPRCICIPRMQDYEWTKVKKKVRYCWCTVEKYFWCYRPKEKPPIEPPLLVLDEVTVVRK